METQSDRVRTTSATPAFKGTEGEAGKAVEAKHECIEEQPERTAVSPGIGGSVFDYVLIALQQTQAHYSGMADSKASMMITVCSIVLTLGLTRLQDPVLRWPLVGLMVCTFFALLFAILAVLPSIRYPRGADGSVDVLSPSFNLLFFGHFSYLSLDHFKSLLRSISRNNAEIYDAIARDLYEQGVVLARKKYRMLRHSYVVFLIGVLIMAVGSIPIALSLTH